MKTHIEAFYEYDPMRLEHKINEYCKRHNYNPISISTIFSARTYVAFVVVEVDGDG